jgi:hypothetical protein
MPLASDMGIASPLKSVGAISGNGQLFVGVNPKLLRLRCFRLKCRQDVPDKYGWNSATRLPGK